MVRIAALAFALVGLVGAVAGASDAELALKVGPKVQTDAVALKVGPKVNAVALKVGPKVNAVALKVGPKVFVG